MKDNYVLRERDAEEINRLAFQHLAWRELSDFAMEQANVRPGDVVIDLGGGPGHLALDLASRVGSEGTVYCVDNSPLFVDFVKRKEEANLRAVQLDIRTDLPNYFKHISVDKVFCRWVLMFNDQIEQIVRAVHEVLMNGGQFISLEYFNFQAIDIFPKSPIFNKIYDGVEKLIRTRGGDPNVGGQLYRILQQVGFSPVEIFPFYQTGKVNSMLWQWLDMTNRNHKNLVEADLISQVDLDAYHRDWMTKAQSDFSFITAPPLMITMGVKKTGSEYHR